MDKVGHFIHLTLYEFIYESWKIGLNGLSLLGPAATEQPCGCLGSMMWFLDFDVRLFGTYSQMFCPLVTMIRSRDLAVELWSMMFNCQL